MIKIKECDDRWRIQHEVVCVPGQQWKHSGIWHRACCPNVRANYLIFQITYIHFEFISVSTENVIYAEIKKLSEFDHIAYMCSCRVLDLKHAIQVKYKIATQHQVLVVNGGECMVAERRVCSYSAGTVNLHHLEWLCVFGLCCRKELVLTWLMAVFCARCWERKKGRHNSRCVLFNSLDTLCFCFPGHQPHIPVQQRDDFVWPGSDYHQNHLLYWEWDGAQGGGVTNDASSLSHRCLANTTCCGNCFVCSGAEPTFSK